MERSRINRIMAEAAELIGKAGFHLPPFAHWSPEEFRARATPAIREGRLGWDITDYGQGDFDRLGLFLLPCAMAGWPTCRPGGAWSMPKSC